MVDLRVHEEASQQLRQAAERLATRLNGANYGVAAGFGPPGASFDLALVGDRGILLLSVVEASKTIVGGLRGAWTIDEVAPETGAVNPVFAARLAGVVVSQSVRSVLARSRPPFSTGWLKAVSTAVAIVPSRPAASLFSGLGHIRVVSIDDVPRLYRTLPHRTPARADEIAAVLDLLTAPRDCFLCELDPVCDVPVVRGIVEQVTQTASMVSVYIRLAPWFGVRLILNRPWESLASGVEQLIKDGERPAIAAYHLSRRVHDGDVSLATGQHSLVIIEPDTLVNATDVSRLNECVFDYLSNQVFRSPPEASVERGNVVHAAIPSIIRGESLSIALENAIASRSLDIAVAGISADEVRAQASAQIGLLPQLMIADGSPQFETEVVSPELGLQGRIDALWERDGMVSAMFELKTGKPGWGDKPRQEHELQARLYAAMLWSQGRLSLPEAQVRVAYAGGPAPVTPMVKLDWFVLRDAILNRDRAILIDLTGDTPTGVKTCVRCASFREANCRRVKELMGYSPPSRERRDDCTVFQTWSTAVRHEAAATARAGRGHFTKTLADRIAEGSVMEIQSVETVEQSDDRTICRLNGVNDSHFRRGDRVVLVEDGGTSRRMSVEILEIDGDGITVSGDAPAHWARLVEDPSPVNQIPTHLRAIANWLQVDSRRKLLMAGEEIPQFGEFPLSDPALDPYQNEAAGKAIAAKDYLLIWGPPGAGKTRTIARTVRMAVALGRRVLLCAFTNAAVDNMAIALLNDGQDDFLVVGQRARTNATIDARSIPALAQNPDALRERLRSAPVVLSTAHSLVTGRYDRAFGQPNGAPSFDMVVIDEASQLPEPLSLGVARLGRSLILVGDHRQLPPVVSDPRSKLAVTLFDRLWNEPTSEPARVMLSRQYRMFDELLAYSNRTWYDGKLETAMRATEQLPVLPLGTHWPSIWRDDLPLVAAQVEQPGDIPRIAAELVAEAVNAGLDPAVVGVIAPNRDLVAAIHHAVIDRGFHDVTVDTVDRYQGSERDVIVLILHETTGRGTLLDDRRLNVALTRAKRKCIVVLTGAEGAANKVVAAFVTYLHKNMLVVPVSDWLRAR